MVLVESEHTNQEVLVSHRNAFLAHAGRLQLARCIVVDGWPLRRAAERFNVSVPTAVRWSRRYRELGEYGLEDRQSRPLTCPTGPGYAQNGGCWVCA